MSGRPVADLIRRRLANHRLAATAAWTPAELVAWFGAVQAQEYAAARWALGLRGQGLTDAAVEQAFDSGAILRTHAMRPTWHFVAPADIRWLQTLTAPRVRRINTYYARSSGLDDRTLARSRRVIERALKDGAHRTRSELRAALARAKVPGKGQQLALVLMSAELDQVICSGARRGRQFTYALLDQRAPDARDLKRDEALAELTRRYFTSHGPATVRDFVWWSGLTTKDARRGVEILGRALVEETFGDFAYWSAAGAAAPGRGRATAWLLPIYDEYLIAYRDRAAVADPASAARTPAVLDGWAHWLIVDGRFTGTWRRVEDRKGVTVAVSPHRPLSLAEQRSVTSAARRYSAFLEQPVQIAFAHPR